MHHMTFRKKFRHHFFKKNTSLEALSQNIAENLISNLWIRTLVIDVSGSNPVILLKLLPKRHDPNRAFATKLDEYEYGWRGTMH